jgi:penicillin-binding protein 1B
MPSRRPDRRRLPWSRIAIALAATGIVVGAGLWLYVRHVAAVIEATWTRHTTSAPSRIYSRALELYPGRTLTRAELVEELALRGYRAAVGRPVAAGRTEHGRPPAPGEYRSRPDRVDVGLHGFPYPPPEPPFTGFPLRIRLREGRISSLTDLSADSSVTDVRLEPVVIASLFDRRMVLRSPVSLHRVPASLVAAVLTVEDRRFQRHGGVDPVRIVGAAAHDILHGRLDQGGSTLTQQLVKNYYLSSRKTLGRKVREAIMALVLERRHDKDEILEAYLNEVYLGQEGPVSIVGVQEAARHYFSRDISRLDLAQSALLAGMIQNPAAYDPFRHPEAARRRRSVVLDLLVARGRIDREERDRAGEEPLPRPSAERRLDSAPYFVDYVERELGRRFREDALRREGLAVFTTLEPRAQRAAEDAVREGLEGLERAHPDLRRAGAAALQAALVAMDPRTGDVVAMVGGRSYGSTQFNRAVDARRQPGSLFKPFVYLTALADTTGRWTLATPVPDSALTVREGEGAWSPRNYDGEEHGMVSLRDALVHSYNLATVRLAMEAGLGTVVSTARRLGLEGRLQAVPSVSLGAFEATPLAMTDAYATLAGGGIRPEPLTVLQVVDRAGSALEARELRMRRVARAGPVYLVERALQDVLDRGTAASARELGYAGDAAGKTGTSSDFKDAWFAGFTPALVTVVWVGFDDNRSLGLPGARAALPIWVRFMEVAGGSGDASFVVPAGVRTVAVDSATGLRPGSGCGPTRKELFLEGTAPERRCGSTARGSR